MKNICIIFIIILLVCCNTHQKNYQNVTPPLDGIESNETGITISPAKKQVARFENGISVEIPEYAFVDEKGNQISEEVTITMETYNSVAEIIASGIPMVYNDGNTEANFESAGMFQITGKTKNGEVFIQDGKELTVNYPSKVYGDYDFFYFEEKDGRDSARAGTWKKLTEDLNQLVPLDSIKGDFKLKFASDDYPGLAPLQSISWKLATQYGNPNKEENRWVLDQQWSSLEISEPKYGLGKVLFSEKVNYEQFLNYNSFLLSKDKNRIITSHKSVTKIWDKNGRLIKSIDNVRDTYQPVEIKNDKFIFVSCQDGDHIYNMDGEPIGKIDNSFRRHITSTEDRIIYYRIGNSDNVVFSDFKGKVLKEIYLEHDNTFFGPSTIYEHFIVTDQDEIVTNSLDGISVYNSNGKLLKHKEGKYSTMDHIDKNKLLIECLDGTLLIWDYVDNIKTQSNNKDFNLQNKVIDNTWHHSNHYILPNTSYVIINEAGAEYSMLWNYESNSTIQLTFKSEYWVKDSLPDHMLVGYNEIKESYHIYDIYQKKDIITVENFEPLYWDGIYYETSVSKDKKRLLINNNSHFLYYNLDGKILRNFKEFDSLITCSGFINNELAFTISEDGIYRTWDATGNEISSKKLNNSDYIYGWLYDQNIVTRGRVFDNLQFYDLYGNLFLNGGDFNYRTLIDSTGFAYTNNKKQGVLRSLFKLDPNMHQLILRKKDKQFITYVYLDENDRQKINKYYTYRAKMINEEIDRQEAELNTIRRFSINNFGIYNWDRLIKNESSIRFAAKFEFDIPVEYSNINVFLITDINGPAVIKYNKSNWDNFAIDPRFPNKLMAILSGNKVAIFKQEEFEKLDFEKISTQKEHTFEMTIIDEPITDLSQLDQILNQ